MSEANMKKQALLIGINEYQILPGLKYARQDAEAVAEALKQNYCFSDNEVMVLTDAKPGLFKPTDRFIIQDHLEELANQDIDLFILGFWGHSLFRNGKRYLCPLIVKGDRVEQQGLPLDELHELLANIHAKNTCLILDCCQSIDQGESETFTSSDQISIENAAQDIVLRRKEQIPDFQSNVAILNSCKEGQSAYEWDARQHGLFTAHLLDALNSRYDSVAQIVDYTSQNVEKTAVELGKTQTLFCKLEGDIHLPVDDMQCATESQPQEPLGQRDKNELIRRAKEIFSCVRKWWAEICPCITKKNSECDQHEQDNSKRKSFLRIGAGIIGALALIYFFFAVRDYSVRKAFYLKPGQTAGERAVVTIKNVEFAFRWCPAGTFRMGTPESNEEYDMIPDRPHQVTLTKGFWMMETEVTQKQWQIIMGKNPSKFKGDNLPVEQVSWYDCQKFCKRTGLHLPTEAQWEYACRTGRTSAYTGNVDNVAWFCGNSGGQTHSVGTKSSNSWGLYDMQGNVGEWCQDYFDSYPNGPVTDPVNNSGGSYHVYRGGSWHIYDLYHNSATKRWLGLSEYRNAEVGFRCIIVQ